MNSPAPIMTQLTYNHHDDVPGTIVLYDNNQEDQGSGQIILQPQPSADPEDPLNWTRRRKKIAVTMVYVYTFAIGICTTAQYSILSQISEAQGITLAQLNTGTGLSRSYSAPHEYPPTHTNCQSAIASGVGLSALAANSHDIRKEIRIRHHNGLVDNTRALDPVLLGVRAMVCSSYLARDLLLARRIFA